MKLSPSLLIIGFCSTVTILGAVASQYAMAGSENISALKGQKVSHHPTMQQALRDPTVAAELFIQHINYARVALAVKDTALAKQHITQAEAMAKLLKTAKPEKRQVTTVGTGRVIYNYNTDYKEHYYPIETGPIEIKKLDKGPFWANKNTIAVTDADIVYMTLDLRGDSAEKHLQIAKTAIDQNKLTDADNELASLTNAVVKIDNKVPLPSDVARDNIELAHRFIDAGNYDGARFALKHADSALEDLEMDETYKTHRSSITAMRLQVNEMQEITKKNDPSLLQKANIKMDGWRSDIKKWASN